MIMLAEIGDKMPSILSILSASTVFTVLVLALARLRWWLALLALPVFGFWNSMWYAALQDRGFGNLIWAGMGPGYVAGQFVATNVPAVIGGAVVIYFRRAQIRKQRQSGHLCPDCGYPLNRITCPECGASVGQPRTD